MKNVSSSEIWWQQRILKKYGQGHVLLTSVCKHLGAEETRCGVLGDKCQIFSQILKLDGCDKGVISWFIWENDKILYTFEWQKYVNFCFLCLVSPLCAAPSVTCFFECWSVLQISLEKFLCIPPSRTASSLRYRWVSSHEWLTLGPSTTFEWIKVRTTPDHTVLTHFLS